MGTKWFDKKVEKQLVNPAIVRELTKLGLMAATKSKENITILDRIESGLMKSSTTSEVDPATLSMRYGSPIKPKPPAEFSYVVYQEIGTEHISPGAFYRNALMWLRTQAR